MAEKLSAKQAAIEIGTDARTLRKFLRSDASAFDAVGQGNRYEFSNGELKKLKKQFVAWSTGSTKTKAEKVIAEDPTIEEEVIENEPEEAYEEAPEDEDDPFDDIEIEDDPVPANHHPGLPDDDILEITENYCDICERHFKNERGLTVHNNMKHSDN